MLYPKFIVEDDFLIISKCKYHKDIATNKDNVKGGGWFIFKNDTFIFSKESYDFGPAKIEDIKQCIKDDKVFTNKMQTHSIGKEFSFLFDTGSELINLKD